jgi:hypothetical protein
MTAIDIFTPADTDSFSGFQHCIEAALMPEIRHYCH